MPIDPNEAPEGYVAKYASKKGDRHEHICEQCCFYIGMCCSLREGACMAYARKDNADVVFDLKPVTDKPTVKLPPCRYLKDRSISDDTFSEHSEGWDDCLAEVIAALDAAGIAHE